MKICLLSSGSIGNAIVVEGNEISLLIDCGISFKKMEELLLQSGLEKEKVKHLLVTHEHADHAKGVGVCARKLNLDVWSTEKTIDKLYEKGIIKSDNVRVNSLEKYKNYEIGEFKITPFSLSHDATDPIGFVIESNDKKIVILTDTGYVSKDVMKKINNADVYVMEVNHNVEMLHMCDRPWQLKQRILSDFGHLSNEEAAYVLSEVIGERTKDIFIAHISQEANLPELALMTVKDVLKERNINIGKLNFHMTYPLMYSNVVVV